MTELSKDKKQQIEQEAGKIFLPNGIFSGRNKSYIAGATAEATKSLILIEALEQIISDKTRITTHIYDIAADALNQYNAIEKS